MTQQETVNIVNTLSTVFPRDFKHIESDAQKKILLKQWYENLRRYPYEEVHKAVDDYIASSNYAPSIAQLREKLNEERKYRHDVPVECSICGGSGGIFYWRYHTDAPVGWYQHMAVCTCEAGKRVPFRGRLDYDVRQLKNLLKYDGKFKLSLPLSETQKRAEANEGMDVKKVMERLQVTVHAE